MTHPTDSTLSLRDYRGPVLSHAHDHHQFVLPLRGALEMEVGGRGGVVDDVVGALVPVGDRHAFIGKRDARCAILDVPEGLSDALNAAADRARSPYFGLDPALHHLLRFVHLRGAGAPGLTSVLLASALDSLTPDRSAMEPKQLRRALIFMEAQSHRPLTVASIAEVAAVSESRLYELFRFWVGKSPQAHLTALRMARAKRALTGGNIALADLAQACGYADQAGFSRAFKRETGLSPAAYRRRHLDPA